QCDQQLNTDLGERSALPQPEVQQDREHAAVVTCWRLPETRRRQAPAVAAERTSADSRSSTRSSADSIPTESRPRLRGAANAASAVEACVIRAGCSIRLSTPPRLSASFQIRVRPTISTASSSDETRKEIIPPNSRICLAASRCPGWLGRPG